MKKIFLLFILIHLLVIKSYSQPGRLDPSFGKNGIVATDIGAVFNYDFDNSSTGRQVLSLSGGGMYVIVNAPVLSGTVIAKRLANGSADLTYGNKGFSVSVPLNDPRAAIQSDGKIVVVGWTYRHFISSVSLARYNTDGTLDSTFNRDGNEILDLGTNLTVAIQNDGKIVVAGYALNGDEDINFAIARFGVNGILDTSFGQGGKQLTDFGLKLSPDMGGTYPESDYATSLLIQPDGKIFVGGYAFNYTTSTYDFALAKYNTNGSLDNTFDKDGKTTTDFGSSDDYIYAIARQADGKIVVAGSSGSDFALARYNTNGNIDKTFDGNGKKTTSFGPGDDIGNSIAIQSNGKIIVSGYSMNGTSNDFAIARYNANGILDNTFNGNGKQIKNIPSSDEYANSLAIQADGKIVMEGYSATANHSDFTLLRYNSNGSEDLSFNGQGKLSELSSQGFTDYTCVAVQKDKKIVAAGYAWNGKNYDFALARYNTDGSLDKTFSNDGKQVTDFASLDDKASAIAIQSDGKIVLAGVSNADFVIARYNSDGSLDVSFNKNGKQVTDFAFSDDEATSVAIQSDGKIVVAGRSNTDFAVVRYNSNGSLDNTFSKDGKQATDFSSSNDYAYSLAIQKNGKIVVAGTTLSIDGYSSAEFALARYNSDGSLDKTFDQDGKLTSSFGYMYNFAYSVALQDDGKILAAGYSGDPSLFAVARYNQDGSADSTFSDDGKQTTDFGFDYGIAKSVSIQNNGKILVGGYVWKDAGLNFAVASYNTVGKLDQSFSDDGMQVTAVSAGDNLINGIAVANNKLYAAGTGRSPGDLGVVASYLLEESTAPSVTIAIPGNVLNYTAPAIIKVNATAIDKDGSISKVEFYNGTTLLHTETLFPYGLTWKNVLPGVYTLTAKATDNSGSVSTSNRITVTVKNALPIVSITKPLNNATYNGATTINLEAVAQDPDGRITKVQFYNGSTLLRTEYEAPYTYNWINVPAGIYNVTAVATDNWGARTTSASISIKVNAPTLIVKSSRSVTNKILDGNVTLTTFPNPATNIVNLSAKGLNQNKPATLYFISSSGVEMKVMQLSNIGRVKQLDITSMPAGIYTIKIINDEKTFLKQFVKL